jgi:Tfp pilus assembly protein FimV
MKFKSPFFKQAVGGVLMGTSVWALTGALGALSAFAAGPSTAATAAPSGTSAAAHSAQGTTAYTSKAGDTLNKIVASHYKDSPLHPSVLVKAVRQFNPTGLPAKPDQRLKTGTAVHLPAHAQVVLETLKAHLPDGHSALPSGPPLGREHWVRFP